MSVAKASKISPLDPTAAEPFYRQIYNRFRSAIASGLLKPGDRIPSARALTKELGMAKGKRRRLIRCWLPRGTSKRGARPGPS